MVAGSQDTPDPAELHQYTSDKELEAFIQELIQKHCKPGGVFKIFNKGVAFHDAATKNNWRGVETCAGLATHSQWIRDPMPTPAVTKIAFHTTWTKTWVGLSKAEWENLPWHAWGTILDWMEPNSQYPRPWHRLTIWDSNALSYFPVESHSGRGDKSNWIPGPKLLGQQVKAIASCQKIKRNVQEVWIMGEGSTEEGQCMEHTGRWIKSLAERGARGDTLPMSEVEITDRGARRVDMLQRDR